MTARSFLPLYALLLVLAGCTTRIGEPLSMGQGTYMVSGSTLSVIGTRYGVVTDIQRHAADFCASSGGKALDVIRVDTAAPEVWSFPEGTLQFRCG